ncbi:transmembrane protein 131-like [Gadus macrocephalus]|uniref:transmembrane protein 131-like n=1 Tax=Gadus macrocephalus TaxID=80720 RepID=UPI0028CB300E|nr:transmembrane protein 131-like [Gadus macrocephalus]
MAQAERFPNFANFATRGMFARILLLAIFRAAQANKQAFIQTDTILEVFHFGDEGLLQAEPDINSYHHKSFPLPGGNSRPIRFEPPMLDFHEQPVGMPKMEKVYLHNPSPEEISLISISATTAHFHASFFQNRIIPPGGNTSFDVVFLARVVGNVENTLFINTSHHGVFTYQVFGVGIPNPYRLRPFIGARVPVNSSFSPLINIHNPHSEPLQVVEMYSSGGDLHLELPTGQQGGTRHLWEIPPFETKGVMRASFSSREADNHTAFIRIKTNASDPDQFIILPVEVEVTAAPGIYSSIEMLDFGTLRSQDKAKQLNLHLLNSGSKDVQITSIRASPANEAVTIDFKAITLKAGENKYTKVASISFDASKVQKASQSLGKITVKAKEKSYSKLEIPYQAEVLDGYLGFDHTVTLFHIRDSVTEVLVKPIHLTNTFHFAIRVHHVALPDDASAMFKVLNFTDPVLIPSQGSLYIFSLEFRPLRPSTHVDSNILLVTNASKFHLPIRAYTGFLEPLALPPSLNPRFLDFGVLSATDTSSILLTVFNSNPIELVLRPWQVTGESVVVELLKTERGNRTSLLSRSRELLNATASTHKTVILASGYYAVFRVTLSARGLEGHYNAAIHITTDYEILTVPVKAVIAVGTLTSHPKHIVLPPSFPGKTVHQSFSIISSFSQRVKLLHIRSLSDDKRFFYRRLKTSRDELEPKRKSKVAKIYFDASLQCGDYCYVGLPFILKSETPGPGLALQEDMWDADVDLYQMLNKRWKALKESSQHIAEAVFEANADLQKNMQTRVLAQLKWPSIINSSRHVIFPLTSINSSSEVEVTLENPADSRLYIQILPLALYSNPTAVTHTLAQTFPMERLPNFDASTLEFQIHRNQSTAPRSSGGFVEGAPRPHVYNVPLNPEEHRRLRLRFSPQGNHTVTSLLILRNNLTVVEFLVVQGQGCYERLKLGGKYPGPGGFLRFKMVESHLKECTDKNRPKEPNFTLRRSFKVENTGRLPIVVRSLEINGRPCEGFGFKVLHCQEFSLEPNASRDIVIMFTPDFTASRVIRELRLSTAGGSHFVFSLNASLPYHMLASCSSALPRPSWELELYIIISVVMSSMFLLVVVTAYLEALGIWEGFKKRLCYEAAMVPLETGKPFDLREIVRLQNAASHPVTAKPSRGPGGPGRPSPQAPSPPPPPPPQQQPPHPPQAASRAPDGPVLGGQHPGRKARSSGPKQPQAQGSGPGAPGGVAAGGSGVRELPPGAGGHEEQEYNKLLEAMDKDLERPEMEREELESPPCPQIKGAKVKLPRKPKVPKRREEADLRPKAGKGEEPPREETDDSSSVATDTSTTDTEASFREELAVKRSQPEKEEQSFKPKNKKQQPANHTKDKSLSSSSLELPYVTPLENKRKAFTSKTALGPALTGPGSPVVTKVLPSKPRVPRGKLEELRPSPLAKHLPSPAVGGAGGGGVGVGGGGGCAGRSSSGSSSEGESNVSPPPEWDCVPLLKNTSAVDSLHQISLQTMQADPFLKRPMRTPPPPPPSSSSSSSLYPGAGGLGLSPLCDLGSKVTPAPKGKLIKSTSLPGQNGNPTFAAVAAGYDKSPGGSSSGRSPISRTGVAPSTSVDSDCSDSPGPLSPIGNGRATSGMSNTFSAFGSNNLFNLSGVFSGMTSARSVVEPPPSWSDFGHLSSPAPCPPPPTSAWPSETLEPWPCSTASTGSTTTSILGSSSLWSSSPPFSPSIWSTSADSSPLHTFSSPPAPNRHLSDLLLGGDVCPPSPASPQVPASPGQLSPAYNPWSMWRPTLGGGSSGGGAGGGGHRRSSEPWPNPDANGN